MYLLWVFSGTAVSQSLNFTIEPVETVAPERAVLAIDELPDSTIIRRSIMKSHIVQPIARVLEQSPKNITDRLGNNFIVRVKSLANEIAIYIVPTISLGNKPQGSWIIYRNKKSGAVSRADIIVRAEEPLVVSIRPPQSKAEVNKSYMDIRLFNTFVKKDFPVGVAFDILLTDSLSDILNASGKQTIDLLTKVHNLAGTVEDCFTTIMQQRSKLVSLNKGCFNAKGEAVYRDTKKAQKKAALSAALQKGQQLEELRGGVDDAGFAKWVIDGIIAPVAGQGVFIDSLSRHTNTSASYFNRSVEASRNQFFALHWIRNLAAADISLRLRRTVYPTEAGLDVSIDPFARAPLYGKHNKSFVAWQKNVGYQSEFMDALLYYLAVTEPNTFYLGAVSREQGKKHIREYSDIYVFFPYFKSDGSFHIEIFKGITRISMLEFQAKNHDTFTFLVRAPAPEEGLFNPLF